MSVKDFYRGAFAEREGIIEIVHEHAARYGNSACVAALHTLSAELEDVLVTARDRYGDPLKDLRDKEKRRFIAMLRQRAGTVASCVADAAVCGALVALAEELESELPS